MAGRPDLAHNHGFKDHELTRIRALVDAYRDLSVPLSWYPRLEHASETDRSHWNLFADGRAVEWPDLDERIGIDGLIAGRRSQENIESLERWRRSRRT